MSFQAIMTTPPFKKMRLLPEATYERLLALERQPMVFEKGDRASPYAVDLSEENANLLLDESKPTIERIRFFNQAILRQLQSKRQNGCSVAPKQQDDTSAKVAPAEADKINGPMAERVAEKKAQDEQIQQTTDSQKIPDTPILQEDTTKDEAEAAKNDGKQQHGISMERPAEHRSESSHDSPSAAAAAASVVPDIDNGQSVEAVKHSPALDKQSEPNRGALRRRVSSAIREFFRTSNDGALIFRDDEKTELKGADFNKILNFLVPLKNIHPKAKPNGFAAIMDVLRLRDLDEALRFPNEHVAEVFSLYGKKPTAFTQRLRAYDEVLQRDRELAEKLATEFASQQHESASGIFGKSWSTFS